MLVVYHVNQMNYIPMGFSELLVESVFDNV